ncbi:MAG TPA: trypsin-like peptidase domain-containing protein, partial [Pedococcus sp.]
MTERESQSPEQPSEPSTQPTVAPDAPQGESAGAPAADQSRSPWAPPTPPHVEQTQPLDVHHTQALPGPAGQPTSELQHPQQPHPASPVGWPQGGHPQGAPQEAEPQQWHQHWQPEWQQPDPGATAWQQQADQGWHGAPGPSGHAAGPGPAQDWAGPQDWTRSHHALTPGAPARRGPGWVAVVGIAAAAALLAGLLGGVAGGWLGSTGRLDLGRGPSSIPTVGSGATSRPEGSIANIAAKALPSVVTIKVNGADGNGTGSGFVADRQGHIITNNHVVASAADSGTIKVLLSNGAEVEATIAGRDASYDLAVLKTGRTDLPPLTMGSSSSVVVGDQVIAVGAPLGLDSTVTTGIVSALNRPVSPGGDGDEQSYINAIQTDAAINPGNSGGPLLNMRGEVIGVNSAIARIPGSADPQSGNIGVGFSIPSDQVRKTAEQLIRTGKAEHPVIGVILDRQYTGGDGVKILAEASGGAEPVTPDGPAARAGIEAGDLIVEFDGRRVTDPDDLVVAIRAKSVGDEVTMKVRRGERE